MSKRIAFWLILIALGITTPAWSQGKKKSKPADPPPKTTDDKKPEEKKPEDSAAEDKGGPAAQKFAATYDKWKEVLKKLRNVQMKYQTTEADEQEALKKEWD